MDFSVYAEYELQSLEITFNVRYDVLFDI